MTERRLRAAVSATCENIVKIQQNKSRFRCDCTAKRAVGHFCFLFTNRIQRVNSIV